MKVTHIKHCRLHSTEDLRKDLAITLNGRGSRDSNLKRGGGGGGGSDEKEREAAVVVATGRALFLRIKSSFCYKIFFALL
jgi:hypothetical protein